MKKFFAVLICAAMIASFSVCFYGCNEKGQTSNAINQALLSSNGYVDYADDVKLNVEKYPVLADQGLFIVTGYDANGTPIEAAADDEENINEYFDATLPSLIIVHGVQLGYGRDYLAYFNAENENVGEEMGNYFRSGNNYANQRWNLFYFHYEKFADAIGDLAALNPSDTENRIWTRGANGEGSCFVQHDGTYSEADALPYSIAELFAAEYIRTMNAITADFPSYIDGHAEIRTASHSMGGALTVAAVSLLNILSQNGQLDGKLLPNRMALLDSYVGGAANNEFTIAWSGKYYIETSPRANYLYSLKNIVDNAGIAVEFYYNKDGWVPFTGMVDADEELQTKNFTFYNEIKELCAMVQLYPDYVNVGAVTSDGHNAIREWYFNSYKYGELSYYSANDFVYDEESGIGSLKSGAVALGIAPSASATMGIIRGFRGKCVEMKKVWSDEEVATVRCDDDILVTK